MQRRRQQQGATVHLQSIFNPLILVGIYDCERKPPRVGAKGIWMKSELASTRPELLSYRAERKHTHTYPSEAPLCHATERACALQCYQHWHSPKMLHKRTIGVYAACRGGGGLVGQIVVGRFADRTLVVLARTPNLVHHL